MTIPTSPVWPRFLAVYAFLHGLWLALYAFLGKGFGYAGFAPVYAGEMLLLMGCLALLVSRRAVPLFATPVGVIMASFLAWQAACTLPYLGTHQWDALRDSAVWGYALFACIAGALVLRLPGLLTKAVNQYRGFVKLYIVLGPAAFLATLYFQNELPRWPDTNVSIPLIKGGEFCVHLAGMFAYVYLGLGSLPRGLLVAVLAEILLGMNVRGGLLAFFIAIGFILLCRPRWRHYTVIAISAVTLVLVMAASDVRIEVPRAGKEFSLSRLSGSLMSMVAESQQSSLENTKRWRLMWWKKIWDYTVEGPYFWTGKGYGVNLADSDGFQVGTRDEPLRSPHNSHMTFLARSGVPGFLLWAALQLTWAGSMLIAHNHARNIGLVAWSHVFIWILAYWLAFMVSAGFDVFLEGPMAGIPFWTLFGLGWGAHLLFRSRTASPAAATAPRQVLAYAHR